MRGALKFMLALVAATLVMLAFRAIVFTTYTVSGAALEPLFVAGDHVLVNKWSYGLRTNELISSSGTRLFASQPCHGDLVAFNLPSDKKGFIANKPVYICFVKAVPGDTVSIGGSRLMMPGRMNAACVSATNIRLLCYLYNHYEGRKASIVNDKLFVDGRETRCASFSKDYYWMATGKRTNCNDSRFFGPVPSDHLIGKVSMLLYSADPARPFYRRLRAGRTLIHINSGFDIAEQVRTHTPQR